MKARHIISIVILALSISSCCVPRKCPYFQAAKDTKDSTYYHVRDSVVYRDSTILVPVPEGTSSNVTEDTLSHIETLIAVSEAWLSKGVLHHTLRNKHEAIIPIVVNLPQYLHYEEKHHLVKVTNTVEVNRLTQIQSFFVVMGKVLSGLLALLVIWIIVKKLILKK